MINECMQSGYQFNGLPVIATALLAPALMVPSGFANAGQPVVSAGSRSFIGAKIPHH
jgi:hypothetical protein